MLQAKSCMSLPTLVLNKGWIPISITPVHKAITKSMVGLAMILNVEDFSLHAFEDWMQMPVNDNDRYIATPRTRIKVPEIIVLTEYERFPLREVRLTRRNLLIRDNYTCQYTGVKITYENGTIDHIIPRSRGGKSTWNNLVMCCLEVNARKADRTPEEAGLRLLKKPEKPKWSPIFARFARLATEAVPKSWHKFVTLDGNPFGWVDV